MNLRIRHLAALSIGAAALFSSTLHADVSVTTYHNDNSRTGQNIQENILTPANVNSSQFGKLFSVSVDGYVYAQPLYLPEVSIGGSSHHVLYIVTEHDSVYALDADVGTVLWMVSVIPAGGTTVNSYTDLNCTDISPEVGITSTPVIDTTTGTLYLVAKSKVGGSIVQYLHAMDVATGAEKMGGPVDIQASVAGTAADGNGSTVFFSPRNQNQRAALLLENGHLVIGWSSHCDYSPWHGWLMSYNAASLAQEAVFNASPNGYGNGVWMSGGGLAADAAGNIFFATGNGSWNGTTNFGDSIVKLGSPSGGAFPVEDYFTPFDQGTLATEDQDVASGGVVLLPPLASGQQLLAQMGKNGTVFLLDRNNMGQYCVNQSPACAGRDPQIIQEIVGATPGVWGSPAYWNGNLYWGGASQDTGAPDNMKAFSFNANGSGLISTTPTSKTAKSFESSAPIPSISASGTTNGIVWGLDDGAFHDTCKGGTNCQVLYAYNATNLANMLYNSSQAANNRDVPGSAVKFATPTIANGKVYVGGQYAVSAFGLLGPANAAAGPSVNPAPGTYSSPQTITLSDTTAGAVIYYTTNGAAPTTSSATYTAPLTISATTTIQALAAANGYANSPVTSATFTLAASGNPSPVDVSLASIENVFGVANNGSAPARGGLDNEGNAYSANLLGTTLTWSGITFALGGPAESSALTSISVALPAGSFSSVSLLATAVAGNQTNQTFVVTYTDGTTSTFKQSLSDWFTPQNYPGESIALSMAYRVTPTGATQNGPFNLYGYTFSINAGKTVKSITLPYNRKVVILAIALTPSGTVIVTAPPPPPPSPGNPVSISLTAADSVYAMTDEGTPAPHGGIDTLGYAYSAALIGPSINWSGVAFAFGSDDVPTAASGATVALPAGNFSHVYLLATGVRGNQAGQSFVLTYTDGTRVTVKQSLSDWFTPQSYAGESIASTMAYRIGPSGSIQNGPLNLYGYAFALDNTKTVMSLALPANRDVVVLAVSVAP